MSCKSTAKSKEIDGTEAGGRPSAEESARPLLDASCAIQPRFHYDDRYAAASDSSRKLSTQMSTSVSFDGRTSPPASLKATIRL
mmetsp:Transcript_1224/g.5195  ORF Transcript_1224/g.5195 Transcript_1224/m.5195 type:complete len:84 (+) Transcript_1224:1331-1582(+)|eukprot:scaffold1178_cov252-Pinguiococcus_pyrenoidosus.AAC.7